MRYLDAADDNDVERLFSGFICKKNCDRSFYSYITIGQIVLGAPRNEVTSDTLLLQKKASLLHT